MGGTNELECPSRVVVMEGCACRIQFVFDAVRRILQSNELAGVGVVYVLSLLFLQETAWRILLGSPPRLYIQMSRSARHVPLFGVDFRQL